MTKRFSFFETLLIVVINALIIFTIARAWTEPSSSPPEQNILVPINVGSDDQTKSGAIFALGGIGAGGLVSNGGLSVISGEANFGDKIKANADICFGTDCKTAWNQINYASILDEGSNTTPRNTVNFTGDGVSCVDNAGSSRTDCTIPGGAAGNDQWTYLTVNGGSDFPTNSTVAVNVPGLALTVAASTKYELECSLIVQTNSTSYGPKIGLAWSSGLIDGVATIRRAATNANSEIMTHGNINATVTGGYNPFTTVLNQSWPARISAFFASGASPSGTTRVQLSTQSSGATVKIKSAGSFCRYRTHP